MLNSNLQSLRSLSGRFVREGIVGYVATSGAPAARVHRLHLNNRSNRRVALTAHKDSILRDEPGWTLDGPLGSFL
ncbi:hypothetical protein [Nonomuraea sp. NPDC050783]|uniref:hypothetical protein n=1 Tax=Nonomuraea sp. NPDC050783 TaxID=3154634 RepID=UPI00346544FB